jgi:hypothetical protein
MANLTFLSAASIEANKEVLSECVQKQGIPPVVVQQFGESLVGVPVLPGMLASIFAVVPREDGGYSLKVSFYVKDSFKLAGWVVAYPESVQVPEGRAVIRVNDTQAAALASYDKSKTLFFDLDAVKCVSLKIAIGVESHYVKDANNNRIPTGEIDAKGNQKFKLAEHPVLTFASGFVNAPLCGTGITGSGITLDEVAAAEERLAALMSSARSL